MMQDLVSVIVPAYNIDKFLTTCVDSLVNQTYTNLEIFLVDDGSTDSTPQLCDMYGRRDNRVHVIHQPNQGQCSAGNAALDRCTGDYMYYYRDNHSGTMKMQKDLSEKGLKSLDDWKYIHYRFAESYPEFNALTANRWVKKYLYVLHELRLHKDTDRDNVYKEKIQKTLCDQRDYFVRIGVDRAYIREIDRIQYGRGIVGFVRKRTRKRAGNKTE